jgi:hypothetical protein
MSHFTVTVVVPKEEATGPDQILAWVEKVLAPYDEDLRVWNEETEEIEGEDISKWDFWTIGGRWTGYFKARPGTENAYLGQSGSFDNPPKPGGFDIIRKADVDWEGMLKENCDRARAFFNSEDFAKYAPFNGGSDQTEAQFVAKRATFATFAIVDKDGSWYQRGDMGWWGVVTDETEPQEWGRTYAEYIGTADDDDYLVSVDCHV